VSWDSNGPALTITAWPSQATAFATYRTRANLSIYFTYKGRLVPAPYTTQIQVKSPAQMTVDPVPLTLAASTDLVSANVMSSTFAGRRGTLTFLEPRSGSTSSVLVDFEFPWSYYLVSLFSGLLGSLLIERNKLVAMTTFDRFKVAFAGSVAGLLLYVAALAGLQIVKAPVIVLVGVPSAFLIGFIGGTATEGVISLISGSILGSVPRDPPPTDPK
jgi:hypothetical protein